MADKEAEGHGDDELRGLVVLHRLALDDVKRAFLRRVGFRVLRTGSVSKTVRTVEEHDGPCAVVFDISVGSHAPERIVEAIARISETRDLKPIVVAATARRGKTKTSRCRKLGLDAAYVWPEGAFAEVTRRLETVPGVTIRRGAERAALVIDVEDVGTGFEGKLINLSSTGALLSCGPSGRDVDRLQLELEVMTHTTALDARVVWRREVDDGWHIGVQFRGASGATRKAIQQFVHAENTVRAKGHRATDRPPAAGPKVKVVFGQRTDYYRLEGDIEREALLVQPKPFFVPYGVGDQVTIRSPGAELVHVVITDQCILDPDRLNGSMGWRVVRADRPNQTDTQLPSPASVQDAPINTSEVERLGELAAARLGTDELRRRFGPSVLVAPPGPGEGARHGGTQSVFTLTIRDNEHLLMFDERCRVFPLSSGALTLGRAPDNDVVFDEPTVSSHHAELRRNGQRWALTDLGSSNGSSVGGSPLESRDERRIHGAEPVFLGFQRMHILAVERLAAILDRLQRIPDASDGAPG